MSYWEDGTIRSTGNAFDTPMQEPETYQQRRNRLYREATAMRKAANKVMRVNRWIAPDTNKQASADKTAKLKGNHENPTPAPGKAPAQRLHINGHYPRVSNDYADTPPERLPRQRMDDHEGESTGQELSQVFWEGSETWLKK